VQLQDRVQPRPGLAGEFHLDCKRRRVTQRHQVRSVTRAFEAVAILPVQLTRPLRTAEHLPLAKEHPATNGQPRCRPRARGVMCPPRWRRRRRRDQRHPEHQDTLPRSQEQGTLTPGHRRALQPALALQPPSVTPGSHLTPSHRVPPRIQRRRPTPSQPPQACHRPRTRPQHPTHRLPPPSPASISQQPPVPQTSPPSPPNNTDQLNAHDYPHSSPLVKYVGGG
jgi:hypothetical protein